MGKITDRIRISGRYYLFSLFAFYFLQAQSFPAGSFDLIFESDIDPDKAREIAAWVTSGSADLSQRFDLVLHQTVPIIFRKNLDPQRFHEWGIGFFVPTTNSIHIKVSAVNDRAELYRVLKHEMIHAYIHARYGRHIPWPLWFEEGLAQHFSGETLGFEEAQKLSIALAADRILAQDEMLSYPRENPYQVGLFYMQSLFIVSLLDESGKLGAYLDPGTWSAGTVAPPGFRDWLDFEIWWQTELESRYGWYVWLNFESIIGILFVIAFLAAYITKLIEKKRRFALLEAAEPDESEDREN